MLYAHRVQKVLPSATLSLNAKTKSLRAAGRDIINLAVGEPDSDTPEHIKQAAIAAISAGFTKYTAVEGTPELKQAIIHKFATDNQLQFNPAEILVSSGGKQCIYNLCMALLQAGDEVLIPAPYWVSYPDMAILADATPVIVPTDFYQQFKLTPELLARHITAKTKLLIFNSPSNPTGVVYTRQELVALGQVLREHPQLTILSDDLYEKIYWAAEPFCNILQACPELRDRCVIVNGVSKAYAMTGWRIGYAAGPQGLIAEMAKVQSQSTSNPCSISQVAAKAALEGEQNTVKKQSAVFHKRYQMVEHALLQIPGIECAPAGGAFYAFPKVAELLQRCGISDDLILCDQLLENGVAVVPGQAFGAPGFIRISTALSDNELQTAMQRIQNYCSNRAR